MHVWVTHLLGDRNKSLCRGNQINTRRAESRNRLVLLKPSKWIGFVQPEKRKFVG